jgi:phage terminase large subunit-like protein
MRLAISRAVAIETSRGWRITKEKQSHKIDVVIALAMAAYATVHGHAESSYNLAAFTDDKMALFAKRRDLHSAGRLSLLINNSA